MDLDKLYQLAVNNQFTDIIIVLEDGKETITIKAHKCILYTSCPYFEKMFSTTMKESIQSIITIQVPNSHVFCDIIFGFYGQKIKSGNIEPWKYQLDTILCRDFLGLEITSSLLNNLVVPPENFDDLLKIIDLIGFDDYAFDLITNNIPTNYDLTNLSDELLKYIYDRTISQKFLYYDKESSCWKQRDVSSYEVCSLNFPENLPAPKYSKVFSHSFTYNFQYNLLAYLDDNDTLFVIDMHTNQLTYRVENMPCTNSIKLIDKNNLFLVSDKKFTILDLETNQCKKSLEINDKIFEYSYFCGDIYICCYENSIDLYNITDLKLIRTHKSDKKIISLTYSSDNTLIACIYEDWCMNIWSIETGELINSVIIDFTKTSYPKEKIERINFKYGNNNVFTIFSEHCIYQFNVRTGIITYVTSDWELEDVIDCSFISNDLILLRYNETIYGSNNAVKDSFEIFDCHNNKFIGLIKIDNPLVIPYYTNNMGRKIKSIIHKE
ncbi:WD40 family protein [Acanthamoeba polyphaga mimivirus]|uniref:WD40 family protein n=1 Tax=Acanthamoeba polyphaga mimivirus Kroon TaxID=3069720 RepID=A0A0G2Y407_9VIRU|nr:WD40 family protein [Acanthamoeba polyphaga mimivirus]AKI80523.1 WD40 family protein [Acanthamoeba polyphaga mimivirus Kroon]